MESFEHFGQKLVYRVILLKTWRSECAKGHAQFLPVDPGLSKSISSKPTKPIVPNFM